MTRFELAPGYWISRAIKGGWQLAGGHGSIDADNAIEDMRAFVESGLTTFDCADIYTGVEDLIGAFARRYPELGREVQIHTKYVPDLSTLPTLTARDVEIAIDRSLRRLDVDTIDLVQFHWWDYDAPRYVDVALALDALRRKGKIRHLGATNFDVRHLSEILAAGVPLVAHQVQYSVFDRRPAGAMAEFCETHGLSLLCYGSLLGGFLSPRWLGADEPEQPFENRSLTKYKLVIDECGGWDVFQDCLRGLDEIGAPHRTTLSTVGIAYVLAQPAVAAAIVGARNRRHIPSTLQAMAPLLGAEERDAIEGLVPRALRGDVYGLERRKDGAHAAIMRYDLNSGARRS